MTLILSRYLAGAAPGIVLAVLVALLDGCATTGKPGVTAGRWIQFDPVTQRFAIDAQNVPRGALLDDLKTVEGTVVRPQPNPEGTVTAKASNLDLDSLLTLLLPAGEHVTVRPGERDLAVAPSAEKRKQGPEYKAAAAAVAKPDAATERKAQPPAGATLKGAPETPIAQREMSAPRTKPASATLLRVAGADQTQSEPKKPLPARAERETLRLQLEFQEGAPPRIVDARAIEGRPPVQRFVTGEYLYALVATDGRVLEVGTFQDPLVEHSYLPEGQHSEGRTRTGVVGISLTRQNLAAASLRIVDLSGVALPRELDERTIRAALEQGKTLLQVDAPTILRLEQGAK